MTTYPLELRGEDIESLAAAMTGLIVDFVEGLADAPAMADPVADDDIRPLLRPPAEQPGDLDGLLDVVRDAARAAIETAGPGYLAYIPGGGLVSSALAEMVARSLNRYTGLAAFAPKLVALEESTIRWMCAEFGLPAGTSGGLLTTGGSMATLTAAVAARTAMVEGRKPLLADGDGDDLGRGTVYVSAHTHRSVAKAAYIAGLRPDQVRTVPTTAELRMDHEAAAAMILDDLSQGHKPFLLVGTAGTTDTGTVDPLPVLAEVAHDHGLWFHVDAAYGGFFQLTERGRARMAGIEQADSITLDPHKGLFLPYGTGALLVRDRATLRRAFADDAHYLQDVGDVDLPDYAHLGPELTRDYRGLRVWLPLHLHGVAAFREALDEKLDLARFAHDALADVAELELPWEPDLSIVTFRLRRPEPADDATLDRLNLELITRINATRRIHISSTRVDDRVAGRLCFVSFRTHRDRAAEAVEIIREAAGQVLADW